MDAVSVRPCFKLPTSSARHPRNLAPAASLFPSPMAQPTTTSRLLLMPPRLTVTTPTSLLRSAFSCSSSSPCNFNSQAVSDTGRLDTSWMLSLERGIGKAYGAEAELQATGAFRAEVFPDLPIATTWQNLAKALSGGLAGSSSSTASTSSTAPPFAHYTTRPGTCKVVTAAANLRSKYDIECRLVAAAGDGAESAGGQRANALLCVSGSHPVRSLPLVSRFLYSSLDTLRLAERLRQRGHIHPDTQLWVVANPNTERSAALLEAKASLGASVVLTQPPLDWPAYLTWLANAERRGLLRPAPPPSLSPPPLQPSSSPTQLSSSPTWSSSLPSSSSSSAGPGSTANRSCPDATSRALLVSPGDSTSTSGRSSSSSSSSGKGGAGDAGALRLLVGHPVLSSAANLSFWISLSGCGGSTNARALISEAAKVELQGGAEAAARHFAEYNRRLVRQVLERGCVAGLHVMPITKASKRMVMSMLGDGSLPPSAGAVGEAATVNH